MIKKILLFYYTIKYLKPQQIAYRIYYLVRAFLGINKRHRTFKKYLKIKSSQKLVFENLIQSHTSYIGHHSFFFLNMQYDFEEEIDWNWSGFGKLWTYNLNYFDFLLQPHCSKETGIELMLDFASHYDNIHDGHEAYPTSLRILNWIKFVSFNNIKNEIIDRVIITDLKRLQDNIEYQLMGNHLLENGFALLFGAFYFNDTKIFGVSESILESQINEQVLNDGAHFELSPMYHQIILTKTLDCINLLSHNEFNNSVKLLSLLKEKSRDMLGWLQNITFNNGNIPHVNDSTYDIAPHTELIENYANILLVQPKNIPLKESGYRKYVQNNYEMLVDVGDIGPDYIPGHAHSDTLNFILHHKKLPVIIDTGISTYEKNEIRQMERSTSSHNTVMVNNVDQSQVWGGFRVAKRAKSTIIKENQHTLIASHNGYNDIGIIHYRSYTFSENKIVIGDSLNRITTGKAFLHFHPDILITLNDNCINGKFGKILIEGADNIENKKYLYSFGFNRTIEATVIIIEFKQNMETTILPL